jgi:transcriptional regulator with XRE-family HTH domain
MTETASPLEQLRAALRDISRWATGQDPGDVEALAATLRAMADALERQTGQELVTASRDGAEATAGHAGKLHASAEPRKPRRKRQRPRSLHHEPQAVTWAREKAGLTKRALARTVGISEQLLGEIESGWRSATPSNLARIADALNCPVVVLERKRWEAAPINGDGNATAEGTPEMDPRSPRADSDAQGRRFGPSPLGPEGSALDVGRGAGGAR